MTPSTRIAALAALIALGACAPAEPISIEAPLERPRNTGESELQCSRAARDRYLAEAAAHGLIVRGQGAGAEVIARTEAQARVLSQLYAVQIADLDACRARFRK